MKLFQCYVQLEVTMAVAANSQEEAQAFAEKNYKEEADNIGAVSCHVERLRPAKGVDLKALPWNVPDDDPRRDWTCEKWLGSKA